MKKPSDATKLVLKKSRKYTAVRGACSLVYRGIANYGHNPSFNYKETATLEIHLLDFNGDLYGETIKVEFVYHLRDEIKFQSKEEFIEAIENELVLVDFYATWCGPCQLLSQILDKLEKNNKDLLIVKVDVDKHPEIAKEHGVLSIPTRNI